MTPLGILRNHSIVVPDSLTAVITALWGRAVSVVALSIAGAFVGVYLTQRSPSQAGNDYMPVRM